MSAERLLLLSLSDEGQAELLDDGKTVWASDSDPDVLAVIDSDVIRTADLGDVLDYLVDTDVLTDEEAENCPVEAPEDDDEDDLDADNDDDFDEDEEDEEDELEDTDA